ncbi:hypothetical protein F4808DRAFT_149883 [Astrocystis sublimbata]|nr:hypothetical protein F4808DRAFT_149883 [Astrocystis sublimbata]
MSDDHNTPTTTSAVVVEQAGVGAIMASLPPTKAQKPASTCDTEADARNTSILAVRGLRTTAMGNELYDLADLSLRNFEIATTPVTASTVFTSAQPLPVTTSFEPFYFFFYGSLQAPHVLSTVCGIQETNILFHKNASVSGWTYKMWGPYPALVPAAANTNEEQATVKGRAWLCEKPEHVARLSTYETNAYRLAYVDIRIEAEDGSVVVLQSARTFVCNQDPDELEDGSFDIGFITSF